MKFLGNLGVGGGIGFLVGVILVLWIEPTNAGGVWILMIISIVLCTTIGGIVSAIRKGKNDRRPDDSDSSDPSSEEQPLC